MFLTSTLLLLNFEGLVLQPADRIAKAAMVPFPAETYLPVTPDNFWSPGQSKEVTNLLQPSREKLYRLLSSGTPGKLEAKFIRFGLVTASGVAVWVDKFGGVQIGERVTSLSKSNFLALQRLVPDPWALPRDHQTKPNRSSLMVPGVIFSNTIPARLNPAVEIASKEFKRQLRIGGSDMTIDQYTVVVGTKAFLTYVRFTRKPNDSPFVSMNDIGSYLVILNGSRIVKRTTGS